MLLRTALKRNGEEYCTHVLMNSGKTDEMLDKASDLTIFSNTFNKLRNTEGPYKILPFTNI